MVANELHWTIDQVSQADIDAAMLEALDQLDDPVDTTPIKAAPRLKTVKKAKVTKSTQSTASKKSTKERHSSKKDASVDRLKSYVAKCGVRKVWKRELQGLSTKESIAKLESILRELGMEGIQSV